MIPDPAAAAAAASSSASSGDGENARHRHRAHGDAERSEQPSAAPQPASSGVLGEYRHHEERGERRGIQAGQVDVTGSEGGRKMNNAGLCFAVCL